MALDNESQEIDAVVARIADRVTEADAGEIRAEVEAELAQFKDAHVRDFVPVLVESTVTDRFRHTSETSEPVVLESLRGEELEGIRGDESTL